MRFWSPQQKYLLKVLNVTGCMRKSQVLPLLCRQFDISPNAIAPICRQLRDAGYLREFDGIISAVGPHYEPFDLCHFAPRNDFVSPRILHRAVCAWRTERPAGSGILHFAKTGFVCITGQERSYGTGGCAYRAAFE